MTTSAAIHGETYDKCLGRMRTRSGPCWTTRRTPAVRTKELADLIYPDCWEEGIIDPLQDWLKNRSPRDGR